MDDGQGNAASKFTTTHWSVVLKAGNETSSEATGALNSLCKWYRYPLYVHVRRLGWGPEDAEDLTHQFLIRFIERKYLQRADPQRGRFRSFLLTSLKHFLSDEWQKLRAQKRGGTHQIVSWDGVDPEEQYRMEPAVTLTPDLAYEKRWAALLLDRVLGHLQADYETSGALTEFKRLKDFVWGDGETGKYADVAAELKIEEGSVKVKVHRLRKHFRQQLRMEILRTVSSPEDVDDELRHLQAVMSC